jgi:arylsulfatase A-like enzyme
MDRRTFLRAGAAAPFLKPSGRAASRRPNVVMFMTDDHGAWATGAYGCAQMHTPNIDALAAGGARFTNAFACTPVCSPSRMTYLTGRLPSTHGVQDWLRPVDSFGEKTRRWLEGHTAYSELLAREGYTLGLSGKWHMGDDEKAQAGFSYWATVPGGGGSFRDVEFVKNGARVRTQGFKTDRVGDHALEFLDSRRGKEDPFYLLVPFYAPHTPYDYQPQEYRAPYEGSNFSCFPRVETHPWQNRGLRAHHNNRASMHAYSALITGLDANVGRIVRRLEEMKIRENTLVVFTADQGWNAGQHGVWGKGNGTWPFNMYEESIRVPMIWNQPGRIRAGATPGAMVSSYDYFPTILQYLGIRAPSDRRRPGRSYAGFLSGQSPRWENRLYFEYSFVRAVRTQTLKYIERTREWPSELYDLEADPGETKNLIDDAPYRSRLTKVRSEMAQFFSRAGAPPLEQWRTTTRQELTAYER